MMEAHGGFSTSAPSGTGSRSGRAPSLGRTVPPGSGADKPPLLCAGSIRAELARRELARRSYAAYLAYTGGSAWKNTRFSAFLAGHIQRFIEADTGSAYDILLIESPPQHGKSMTVTEALPSWYLGRWPERRVILASYNDDTAVRFSRRNRDKLERYGGVLWGVEGGRTRQNREWEVVRSVNPAPLPGSFISRGILAGITGNPADLLIIDDPVKNRQEADSETRRKLVWEEWLNSLKSRLAAGAKVIVIMTPWHEDDLAGRLQAAEPGLELLRLPVEAEENDPMGRPVGAALCPELGKGDEWLAQYKTSYINDPEGGARAWTALYQWSPRVEEGALIKRSWWRYYSPAAADFYPTELISVDATFKGGEQNDFVAIQVWGKRGTDYFLRYCMNRHMDFPETLTAIRAVKQLYPMVGPVLIEDKANGSAVISVLQKEMFCIPVNPKGGKEARVHAVSAAIESGHVFLPEGEPWVEDFVDQFTAFPAGKHDDMVDAASQALTYMLWSCGGAAAAQPEEEPDNNWHDPYDVYGG